MTVIVDERMFSTGHPAVLKATWLAVPRPLMSFDVAPALECFESRKNRRSAFRPGGASPRSEIRRLPMLAVPGFACVVLAD